MGHHSRDIHYTSDFLSGFERVRVDVAQTSFFEGREFHMIREISLPTATTLILKVVVTVPTVVHGLDAHIDAGHLRIAIVSGGTEGGTFVPLTTGNVHPANSMPAGHNGKLRRLYGAAPWVPRSTWSEGGTLTGGDEIDILRLLVANASGQASMIGAQSGSEHAFPAGTYYLRIQNLSNGTTTGVVKARWEERSETGDE